MLMMSDSADSKVRIFAPEQARALLELHTAIPESSWRAGAATAIVRAVAEIAATRVALANKDEGAWTIVAATGPKSADLSVPLEAGEIFDRVADAPAVVVESWNAGEDRWTLVGLTRRSMTPAVLMLAGDWTTSTATLERLGQNLLLAERAYAFSSTAHLRAATHRLTRALASSSGFENVASVAVRNVAGAVRARHATHAVADAHTQTLRIKAKRG
jgi:hypothetical protein